MKSETRHDIGEGDGLPFTRPVARKIVEELFRQRSQWKSREQVDRVADIHRARSGVIDSDPACTVRRALKDLERAGSLTAPGHGWWRWSGESPDAGLATEVTLAGIEPLIDHATDHSEANISVGFEKQIGEGSECVYLYYNPNDRLLAEHEGRDVWECKVGRTSNDDPNDRIVGQGISTALSRKPKVGLIIRTDDSRSLESALHCSLRLVGAKIPDSPGNEWFRTSPARVETWFAEFETFLVRLRFPCQPSSS